MPVPAPIFPLDTDDRPAAADRATQIYRQIAGRNEMAACQQFRRELTVAFRWLDNPLMWSYTTIHTTTGEGGAGRARASGGRPVRAGYRGS